MQGSHDFCLPGMDKILIHGGHPLSGSIKISGSKNSALPIIAASLLTREPCILHRVPDLSDTNYMLQILMHLGAEVERASGTVTVRAEKVSSVAPYEIVRKMRASVCVLGPLLGRCNEATVSLPGGCVIGDRPIDLHLKGFEALGAAVRVENGNVKVFAPKLIGAIVHLQGKFGPTVLGTDNVMMAAVLAEGVTVIDGAASEPEVVDLANFLNKMGAKIEGAGTRRMIIEGVAELHGAEHDVIPDRIETGTFLVAGAICGKGITLKTRRTGARDLRDQRANGLRIRRRGWPQDDLRFSQWHGQTDRPGDGTFPWLPDRHAGANVRAAFHHAGDKRDYRKHFPAALHACGRTEENGCSSPDRRCERGHSGRGSTLRRAGHGERSARLGRFGAGRFES